MEKANMMVYVGEMKFYPTGAIETLFVGNGYFKDVLEEREEENMCLLNKAAKLGDKIKYIITQVYEIDPLAAPRKDVRTDLENIFDADEMGRFCYVTKKILNLEDDLLDGLDDGRRFVLEEDEDEEDEVLDKENSDNDSSDEIEVKDFTFNSLPSFLEYELSSGRTCHIESDLESGIETALDIKVYQDDKEIKHRVCVHNIENQKQSIACLSRWTSFWFDAKSDCVKSIDIECMTDDSFPETYLELEDTKLVIKGILCPDTDDGNHLLHYTKWENIHINN